MCWHETGSNSRGAREGRLDGFVVAGEIEQKCMHLFVVPAKTQREMENGIGLR